MSLLRCLPVTVLVLLLFSPAAASAEDAPLPCKVLTAEEWGKVVGSSVTATPGDMNCSYVGKASGGQLRILAVAPSAAQARAVAASYASGLPNTPGAQTALIDSKGLVVFSIALFQDEVTRETPIQLQGLLAAVKRNLK
jgi:hypothetical protein